MNSFTIANGKITRLDLYIRSKHDHTVSVMTNGRHVGSIDQFHFLFVKIVDIV